ncbi:ATP-binding protein [Marinicella rhabdoformis]|uniref:ATP-binding protein n=1 Tax=Marinicella rhabdoformis TaxID=2580566 RepID=UPI0012AED5D3|nr:MoxR family ATPase [Marinicella rhabdoformis]
MTPNDLKKFLAQLIQHNIQSSVMIWGPPGIGKSSVVKQLSDEHDFEFIDIRLSQLAPTDLRGIPVPENGITHWASPEFLPQKGQGILFLDEINMAPPAMQGVAQQLILDRKVGSYRVPPDWYIWAAGNRKEDRAGVFEMPAPLANRFIHLETTCEINSFKQYALQKELCERIIAFLAFRKDLLHQMMPNEMAWPSPRSWVMAAGLHQAGLPIDSAVGHAAAAEFEAFLSVTEDIPDVDGIVNGKVKPTFPSEVSLRYATTLSLVARSDDATKALHALRWLVNQANPEWVQLFAADAFPLFRAKGFMDDLQQQIMSEPKLKAFLTTYVQLLSS